VSVFEDCAPSQRNSHPTSGSNDSQDYPGNDANSKSPMVSVLSMDEVTVELGKGQNRQIRHQK
jgi:hypothetical protein